MDLCRVSASLVCIEGGFQNGVRRIVMSRHMVDLLATRCPQGATEHSFSLLNHFMAPNTRIFAMDVRHQAFMDHYQSAAVSSGHQWLLRRMQGCARGRNSRIRTKEFRCKSSLCSQIGHTQWSKQGYSQLRNHHVDKTFGGKPILYFSYHLLC